MKDFVIFGASGDLAQKKLYPALWNNFQEGCKCNYYGYGRTKFSNNKFREFVKNSVPPADDNFLNKFTYITGPYNTRGLSSLKKFLKQDNPIFYLALPTRLEIVKNLAGSLIENDLLGKESTVVLEKPFGEDYYSAKELMDFLDKTIGSQRTYLIDHYLAKDLVRNLITLRFANPVFENLWCSDFVEKIQIDASESSGIEKRAEYYDKSGAIKDMVQNHVLQVLSLVTMGQPEQLNAPAFHREKLKVLDKLRIFEDSFEDNLKIGQYKGYLKEPGVAKNSLTETFVSMNLEVKNKRWRGVIFEIKTGKKLEKKQTEITVYFKSVRKCLWHKNCQELTQNKLVINFFPRGDIQLQVNTEFNPEKFLPRAKNLVFDFSGEDNIKTPYANALKDIYYDDQLYSPSFEEILSSWEFIDSVENWLEGKRKDLLEKY